MQIQLCVYTYCDVCFSLTLYEQKGVLTEQIYVRPQHMFCGYRCHLQKLRDRMDIERKF